MGVPFTAILVAAGRSSRMGSDKLWVDLPEVPISITAIDATGRVYALQNFQHTSRTVELDVSTLPSGMNILRIISLAGSRTVRFIKT